jgi:hypothetical protein
VRLKLAQKRLFSAIPNRVDDGVGLNGSWRSFRATPVAIDGTSGLADSDHFAKRIRRACQAKSHISSAACQFDKRAARRLTRGPLVLPVRSLSTSRATGHFAGEATTGAGAATEEAGAV